MNQAQRDEWFTAVKESDIDKVRQLINSGFDVNAQDSGKYALSYACEYLYPDIVELLLNSGADINILDNENNNLIHWTLENILLTINDENLTNNEIEDKIKNTEQIIEILRAHHLDTNAINNHQLRPLDMLTIIATENQLDQLLDIQNLLLNGDEGANPDLMNNDIVMNFIDAYVDAERRDGPFYDEYFEKLIENGYNINKQDERGNTFLTFYATSAYERAMRILLHFNADPNIPNNEGKTPLFYVANWANEELVQLLLQNNAQITDVIRQAYQEGSFPEEILPVLEPFMGDVEVAVENEDNANAGPLWKGWTSADIESYQSTFLEQAEANNVAVCPICLKFTYREDGCMYMSHNCKDLPGFYHKELYQKYKGQRNLIFFCTICGRICKEHSHYHLVMADEPKPALWPSGDPFQNDCSISNHGGNVQEKVARFTAIRDKALELNSQIGQISNTNALRQITEAGFNAPLNPELMQRAASQLEQKQFNRPNTNFPAPKADELEQAPINMNALPNIQSPNANLRPLLHRFGENSFYGDDFDENSYQNNQEPDKLIQFRHRQQDGTINNHANEWVSRETLEGIIRGYNMSFDWEPAAGYCVFYPRCNARLYPEEIHGLVPDDLYNEYRRKFNYKFRQLGGRKNRRNNTTTNNKLPFYQEITNGACFLPPKKKNVKKGGKKGAWKTRRHAKKRKTLKQRMNKRKFSQTRRK